MGLLEMFKFLMNGAKLPNWAKLFAVIAIFVGIAALQQLAVGQLSRNQNQNSSRQLQAMRALMIAMQEDNEETRWQIVAIAARDSIRARRIERLVKQIQAQVEEIDEHGSAASMQRIDRIERLLRRK